MEPSTFSITLERKLPIEGNFRVSDTDLSPDGRYLNVILIPSPESPQAQRMFSFLHIEIDLQNHTIRYVNGENFDGETYDEIHLSSTD